MEKHCSQYVNIRLNSFFSPNCRILQSTILVFTLHSEYVSTWIWPVSVPLIVFGTGLEMHAQKKGPHFCLEGEHYYKVGY